MARESGPEKRSLPGSVRPHAPELTRAIWRESDRFLPRRVVRPLLRFMQTGSAPAAVMTLAAATAFLWANSPFGSSYAAFWSTTVLLRVGSHISLDLTVRSAVNEAAMTLFFLLVGIELKRELVLGQLRKGAAAALPAVGALGGMAVPALCYVAFTWGTTAQRGWGVPTATDIAFAIGVFSLLGARGSRPARVFLLTLAVADDLGGIVIITFVYAGHVRASWLVVEAGVIAAVVVLRKADVQLLFPYVALGILAWLALEEAGIEPVLAGVIFGLLVPLEPFHSPDHFLATARTLAERADQLMKEGSSSPEAVSALVSLDNFVTQATPPAGRLQIRLGVWVNLAVLPLFALANAGVHLAGTAIDLRVFLGVVVALVAGKLVGVFSFSAASARLLRWPLPGGMGSWDLATVGASAGVGFAVALFIASLAFSQPSLVASASLGVLAGSLVSALVVLGPIAVLLRRSTIARGAVGDS